MIASWQRRTRSPNLDGQHQLGLGCGLLWSCWLAVWGPHHPGVRASGLNGQQKRRVVTRNVHPTRNAELGRQPFVQHTIMPQIKKKIDTKQKERGQYEETKFSPSHLKITYARPAKSPRKPYYRLKADLNHTSYLSFFLH